MSLTSLLKETGSPTRAWFKARFPNLKPLRAEWRALGPRVVPRRSAVSDAGTLGTAFDYRLRYYFQATPGADLVAAKGAARLTAALDGYVWHTTPRDAAPYEGEYSNVRVTAEHVMYCIGERSAYPQFADALDHVVAQTSPYARALDADAEAQLCRYCVVLALFEQWYRAGTTAGPALPDVGLDATVEQLLALVPSGWTDELFALSTVSIDPLRHLWTRPAVMNPTFAGSTDVGGADADIIVSGCLLEAKTTSNPDWDSQNLWQLIGYLLLDYDDAYALDSFAFYAARQAGLLVWPADETLDNLAGEAVTRDQLRTELREVIAQQQRRPLRSHRRGGGIDA